MSATATRAAPPCRSTSRTSVRWSRPRRTPALIAIVGSVLSGPLSDRTGRRKPFVIGASLVALLGIAIPLFRATPAGMTAFSCVGGLAFGCYYAVDAALWPTSCPTRSLGPRISASSTSPTPVARPWHPS
ncbi:MFS transporter [Streptomyces sp. NPDC007107]|uniref:MFS transporter n=1 Tax=Streptomyces sp. NPDC007107 TaxID=3156915 RepID=UPI0033C22AF5